MFLTSVVGTSIDKRALNRCQSSQSKVCLRQALRLRPGSAEAHNLMDVLLDLGEPSERG